jgi:hypothetical protein
MLGIKCSFKNEFLLEAYNLSISRIVLLVPVIVMYTCELMRVLLCIWSLGKKEPALKVIETMTLEHELYGTFTTNLIHICSSAEAGVNMASTYAVAELVDCVN